ncbi:MAG TPA: hypothetical protein VNT99_13095 [Methylomirabilota bacterium]|nr:hypothetical protein [Methylomirabilota bacterium]
MRFRFLIFASLVAVLASGCFTRSPRARPLSRAFDFALIGDAPYSEEQITNLFPNMIAALNRERLAFVVHDGDIKSGTSPCDDKVFAERWRDFQAFKHPLVYLFGDNEWTDCARATNGFDPVERLAKLRTMFAEGEESLGQRKLRLTRQSIDQNYWKFRENVRWSRAGALFVGLNVPGASNNYGKPEFAERNAANLAWIQDSFALARRNRSRAVMLLMQANPFPERGSTNRMHAGFRPMLELIERETVAFKNPVVLVHGDSHYFRIDKPLVGSKSKRRIENFTRVETFGNPDMHWLRVTMNPRDPDVFTFRPQIVKANVVNHQNAK